MKIKIWDKKTSINGISATVILKNRKDLENEEEILLLEDDYGNITHIEIPRIIQSNLKLAQNLTALEIGQAYLEYLITQENQIEQDKITHEQLIEKTNVLEKENADLLLDAAIKDSKLAALESDMADMMMELIMIQGGTR